MAQFFKNKTEFRKKKISLCTPWFYQYLIFLKLLLLESKSIWSFRLKTELVLIIFFNVKCSSLVTWWTKSAALANTHSEWASLAWHVTHLYPTCSSLNTLLCIKFIFTIWLRHWWVARVSRLAETVLQVAQTKWVASTCCSMSLGPRPHLSISSALSEPSTVNWIVWPGTHAICLSTSACTDLVMPKWSRVSSGLACCCCCCWCCWAANAA